MYLNNVRITGRDSVLHWLAILFVVYALIASTAYRFRHPEKTETQLFLELPQALTWQCEHQNPKP